MMKLNFNLTDRVCGTYKKFTEIINLNDDTEYIITVKDNLIEIREKDTGDTDVFYAQDINKITIE